MEKVFGKNPLFCSCAVQKVFGALGAKQPWRDVQVKETGQQLDSTRDLGQPALFTLGVGSLVDGERENCSKLVSFKIHTRLQVWMQPLAAWL